MEQNPQPGAYDPVGKLIPTIIDELSVIDPGRVFAILPISQDGYQSGSRTITYRKLANAVNGMAKWMTANLGPARDFETIAFIGPHDMGHHIVVLAAIKAGYKCLLISPRYSVVSQVRLMKETGCKNLLVSPQGDTKARDELVAEHGDLRPWKIPSHIDLFDIEAEFPYTKSYEEGKNDPMFVIHTSGTTGFPKPIVFPLDWGVAVGRQRHPTPIPGYKSLEVNFENKNIVSTMPPFHVGFFVGGFFLPFYSGTTVVYAPSTMPPTAKTAAHVCEYNSIDCVSFMPNNVDDLGLDPELQQTFLKSGVKSIIWGGGPAAQKPGAEVAKLFTLFTTMGSSEDGMWYPIRREADWDTIPFNGMCFHPDENIDFRDQGDGLYLAVIVRNNAPNKLQPVFYLFPDETEYNTKDLFRRQSGSGIGSVWHYYGRSDDLLIFPTGSKWHPGTTEENILGEHRDLFGQVLITLAGPNVVVLLEPTAALREQLDQAQQNEGVEDIRNKIFDQIWPTIEDLHRTCHTAVRFDRSRIIFTDADRPMLRTAKGSVQRKVTIKQYEDQILAAQS